MSKLAVIARDVIGIGGAALVIGGIASLSAAAAMIVAGLAIVAACILWALHA
ncbi:MAG: hypothetical protein WCZ28_11345 [Burkholderiaceae bacterium]